MNLEWKVQKHNDRDIYTLGKMPCCGGCALTDEEQYSGKWRARIFFAKKFETVGYYQTLEEAQKAVHSALAELKKKTCAACLEATKTGKSRTFFADEYDQKIWEEKKQVFCPEVCEHVLQTPVSSCPYTLEHVFSNDIKSITDRHKQEIIEELGYLPDKH